MGPDDSICKVQSVFDFFEAKVAVEVIEADEVFRTLRLLKSIS